MPQQAFGNNQLDAFWLFTAFPSGAVIMAAQTNDIEMIDLAADAKKSGYFDKYAYFGEIDHSRRHLSRRRQTRQLLPGQRPVGCQRQGV
jgi:hypothetical protein